MCVALHSPWHCHLSVQPLKKNKNKTTVSVSCPAQSRWQCHSATTPVGKFLTVTALLTLILVYWCPGWSRISLRLCGFSFQTATSSQVASFAQNNKQHFFYFLFYFFLKKHNFALFWVTSYITMKQHVAFLFHLMPVGGVPLNVTDWAPAAEQ